MRFIDLSDRYNIDRGPLPAAAVDGGALHHSVTLNLARDVSQDTELAVLDAIDRHHRRRLWRDAAGNLVSLGGFAYHLAAFPSGRVYLCCPLGMRGAHVYANNGHLVGIVLVGTFTSTGPPVLQRASARDAAEYVERNLKKQLVWKGHTDWAERESPTSCPGDTWPSWALDVQPRRRPPSPPPPPPPDEEPAPAPAPPSEEEDRMLIEMVKGRGQEEIWILTPRGTKRLVRTTGEAADLIALGVVRGDKEREVDPAFLDRIREE